MEPASSTPDRLIGQVEDGACVRDAFADDGPSYSVEAPPPPGTWGLFEIRDGRAHPAGEPLAAPGSALADLYALAARRRLSPLHPPEVMAEAAAVAAAPGIDDPTLEDLTGLPFVTIDEPHSRDLDQAVFVERRDGGFKVWYAIADPAWSVRPGTALFAEALRRGSTYYLPGLVIPMLPRQLSEGTISINPDVDRRSMVFEVDLAADGSVVETRIRRARVRSRLKTSYDAVQDFFDGGAPPAGDPRIAASMELLREVGTLRMELAEARDVVAFQRREIAVSLSGAEGLRFVAMADPRNDVDRYSEQISLLCNVEGARFLREGDAEDDEVQPIYRVHDPPEPQRLAELAEQIAALVRLHGLDEATWGWRRGHRSLASYLEALPASDSAQSGPAARLARAVHRQAMLTSGRSVFATAPGAHFGVGSDVYGRFTAPMREIVGVFLHKETWEKLFGKTWTPPPPWDDDERLREQVIEAANRSRQTQKTLDDEANRRVLDQLFGDDLASTRDDRPARRGTVLGISHTKVYVGLDEPPIDVKVYADHVARQLGGVRVGQGRDGMTLRRLDDGARLWAVGDEVRLRVRGRDEERDRWDLELLPADGRAVGR
jgi:ribonuclease R